VPGVEDVENILDLTDTVPYSDVALVEAEVEAKELVYT